MVVASVTVLRMADWDTWEKRIAWIQLNRGLSMSALSEAAGLARATVGNTIRREREGATVGFASDTLAKLAKTARVDLSWLATGEGQPEPGALPKASPASTVDTQQIANAAARLLVELDGLELPAALMLVHDVRLTQPTVDGYYRAARLRMSRGPITEEVERAAERELQLAAVGANKKRG